MSMPVIKPSCVSRSQAITDMIESVALEQTAISHILNAEGEKIQKVLEIQRISRSRIIRGKSFRTKNNWYHYKIRNDFTI